MTAPRQANESTLPAAEASRHVVSEDRIAGCLLGMAVGDALGLPREGLSAQRAARIFGERPYVHRLVAGCGMISDDAEHACMTVQALLASDGHADAFAASLAWRLRAWLLGGPAGIGLATLRAILKLWVGVPPAHSGVRSAGNGPAMRAPILGVFARDEETLVALNRASTRLTHTDPRAEEGSLLIALTAQAEPAIEPRALLARCRARVADEELGCALAVVDDCLTHGAEPRELAETLGLSRGVSGYMNHTVPVALFCRLRYPDDFREAVESAIALGGDTDTVGAIVGGLMGAALGVRAIPTAWVDGLWEWPRSVRWMQALAERLARTRAGEAARPLPLCWPGLIPRNLFFTLVVLYHGFRRLFPPFG